MIVGFNHNMTYRGICFHVQTEDSGIKTPHLITLLYHGGTIICSQKTSYADILNVDNLDVVIEDLAKEQHKGMLRRLKKGEFDQRISDFGIQIKPLEKAAPTSAEVETAEVVTEATPAPVSSVEAEVSMAEEVEPEPEITFEEPGEVSAEVAEETIADTSDTDPESTDLDDLIFSYLSGDDGKK